jgi:hypothetical protein
MTHDHALVGALIAREWQLYYPSKAAFARDLQVDRTTIYRVLQGHPSIKAATHRRAERLLDLPRGLLDAVREHDTTAMAASGARPEVVAWVLEQIHDTPDARNRLAR